MILFFFVKVMWVLPGVYTPLKNSSKSISDCLHITTFHHISLLQRFKQVFMQLSFCPGVRNSQNFAQPFPALILMHCTGSPGTEWQFSLTVWVHTAGRLLCQGCFSHTAASSSLKTSYLWAQIKDKLLTMATAELTNAWQGWTPCHSTQHTHPSLPQLLCYLGNPWCREHSAPDTSPGRTDLLPFHPCFTCKAGMFDLYHRMFCKWQQNKSEAAFIGAVLRESGSSHRLLSTAGGDIWKEMQVSMEPLLGKNSIQDLWLIYLFESVCFINQLVALWPITLGFLLVLQKENILELNYTHLFQETFLFRNIS